MAYNRKDSGSAREFYGNFLVNSQYAHKVYQVRSTGEGKFTEFKIFASTMPDGLFAPQVVPVDGNPLNGISDAFHCKEMVNWMGSKRYQMITDTVDFPAKPSPSKIFRQRIVEFVKKKGEDANRTWSDWLKFKGGLNDPECKMVVQGVLLALDGEKCRNKERKIVAIAPTLMILPRSATSDLEKQLITPADSSKPISASNCLIGDVTSPSTGAIVKVEIYQNSEGKDRYRCVRGDVYPIADDYVRKSFVPWEKLLRTETAAWQIARLVETFDAAAVDYAFSEDPEYGPLVPSIARGAYFGKKVAMSVAGPKDDIPYTFPQPPALSPQTTGTPPPQYTGTPTVTPQQAPTYAQPQYAVPQQTPSYAPPPAQPMQVQAVQAPQPAYPPIVDASEVEDKTEWEDKQPEVNSGRHYTPPTMPQPVTGNSAIMAALQEAKARALAGKKPQ